MLREESSSELENRILGGSVLSAKAFCFICYLLFLDLLVKYLFTFLLPVLSHLLLIPVEWPGLLFILLMFFLQRYNKQLNNANKTIPNSNKCYEGVRKKGKYKLSFFF